MTKTLEMFGTKEKEVSPEEYLRLFAEHNGNIPNIESVSFSPPSSLKSRSWGKFVLNLKTPEFACE